MALNQRTTAWVRIIGVRRTLCLALLVGAAGVVGGTTWAAPAAEGTLSIKRGFGMLVLEIRGAAIGRIGKGELTVEIPASRSCDELKVWGADEQAAPAIELMADETVVLCGYSGRDIRFRLTGKFFLEITSARNLHLSAAGRGWGFVEGAGRADGVWSLNGRRERNLPDIVTEFVLEPTEAERSANAAS